MTLWLHRTSWGTDRGARHHAVTQAFDRTVEDLRERETTSAPLRLSHRWRRRVEVIPLGIRAASLFVNPFFSIFRVAESRLLPWADCHGRCTQETP